MNHHLPSVCCLCPTYGRPHLMANSVALFLAQDYPGPKRLLILDDGNQIPEQDHGTWAVRNSPWGRFPSLVAKYNTLLGWAYGMWPKGAEEDCGPAWLRDHRAEGWSKPDVFLVWDDDDIYLPWHITANVRAMSEGFTVAPYGWTHPTHVLTDYPGHIIREPAQGRFHGSVGVSTVLLDKVHGWVQTNRADFDQAFIHRLTDGGILHRPEHPQGESYVFRWGTTKAPHCQGFMSSPDNVDWYSRHGSVFGTLKTMEGFRPEFDTNTLAVFKDRYGLTPVASY